MSLAEQLVSIATSIAELEQNHAACEAEVALRAAEILTLKARIAELEAQPIPTPDPVPIPTAPALAMHSGHNGATTISRLNAAGTWLGKPIKTAAYFTGGGAGGWPQVEGPAWLLRDNCQAWLKGGVGRQVSLQLAMMPSGMGLTLAQAASGTLDENWKRLANNLATYGLLGIELRPAHEMDGGWYPWGVKGKPELNATFVAAFRRMVTVMRQAQPTNKWTIVWNTTADNWPLTNSLAYLESIYPGDAYVDQIGADFYDKSFDTGKVYYPSGSDRLQRQKEVWAKLAVRLAIMREFAQKHGKPLQFPEWGLMYYNPTGQHAGYGGGDNPYFIEQMHKFVTDPANNVAMHSYFDVRATTGDDHRISPPSSVFTQAQAKYKVLFGA